MEGLRLFIEDLLAYVFTGVVLSFFTTISFIVFFILIGIILIRLANRFLFSLLKIRKNDRRAKTIGKLINSITKVFVWFIVVVIVLSELGIDIAPFLASAGIVGVALGFGAQSIVKDLISGAFLIMEGAFYVDDFVDVNGFRGTVTHMGLRSTSVQNWRGEVRIINNGEISDLINLSRNFSATSVEFVLPHNADVQMVLKLVPSFLKKAKNKYKVMLEEPRFLGAVDINPIGVLFRIIVKVENGKLLEVEPSFRADLLAFLKEHRINLAKQEIVVAK